MAIYTPYFYIIQDKSNGIYYAGSKYGKDANPRTFMVEGGYTTSSGIINKLIQEHGLSNFIIRKIRTFETGVEAHRYETRFLEKIDARNNPSFYNKHNNTLFSYNTPDYTNYLMENYGVENIMFLSETTDKIKQTCLSRYGNENYRNVKRAKQTKLERYGDENYRNDDLIKQTCLLKYGSSNPFGSIMIQEMSMVTKFEKYGSSNYNNHQKISETKAKRYGSSTFNNRESAKTTISEKYGVEHNSQIQDVRASKSKIMKQMSQDKNDRENVKELRKISVERGIKLGSGWNRRSDEWINSKIDELKK